LPANRIVVGLWGSTTSPETLRVRFGPAQPDGVVSTLAGALQQFAAEQSGRPADYIFARSGPARGEARAGSLE
jgi:hypothetical protein